MSDTAARPRLDDQQRLAVETLDRSVAVVAGAGTGKTTVLVERFLALLDANPDWPITAIVAITFTERAAEEMRSRVRQRILERISTADGLDRRRWADHLARVEAARISTIHGMCSEVIRANAAAAGVDPGFQVADEASAAVLLGDAVAAALRDFAEPRADTSDPDYIAAQAVLTRYDLAAIKNVLASAKTFDGLEPPPATVDDVVALAEQYRLSEIERFFANPQVIELVGLIPPSASDLYVTKVRDAQQLLSAAARAPSAQDKLEILARFDFTAQGGSSKVWMAEDLAHAKELTKAVQKCVEKLYDRLQFDRDTEALALQLAHGWHVLAHRVLAAYEDRKRTENVLDFDDLEIKAEAVLARPEVRRRYAGREVRHVMVDEFQDTNRRQWNIARGLAPELMDGGIFIVGDPKQSIYAFRGADVTIFKAASDQIERAGGLIVRMNRSYRTHSALIEQMNGLFRRVMQPKPAAAQPEQFVAFDDDHVLSANRESPKDRLDVQLIGIDKSVTTTSSAIAEASVVAAGIRDLVTSGSLTVVDGATNEPRPAGYGDFAVLLQSFKGNSKYFEQAFVDFGVPYVTQSGGGFYERREIRDLIELLKALRNPADDLALAAALHSPLFALSDVDLITLRSRGGALYEALEDEAELQAEHESLEHPIVFAHTIYDGLRAVAGHVSADTLLLQAIAETNYLASIGRLPGGRQMRANVEKLVDIARERGAAALPDFIAFLDVSREAEVKEAGVALASGTSVRLTTIHGCKGLEFPVIWLANGTLAPYVDNSATVIAAEAIACKLPGTETKSGNSTSGPFMFRRARARVTEAQSAEMQRLLYVAATRARDALFISSSRDRNDYLNVLSGALDGRGIDLRIPPLPPQRQPEERPRVIDTGFPLAETLPAAPPPTHRRLTATDIADYGGLSNADNEDEREYYRHRIARRLHADDSEPIESLTYDAQNGMPSQRRIGSLVHSALLYRVDVMIETDPERADQTIDSLVWEAGITLSDARRVVVDRVRSYLDAYTRSPIARAIERAKEVYRELPFVIERDGQLVHGTMDLVYLDHDSRWTVVDFKTDGVPDDIQRITAHARRYLLQLAVYAAALRERVGVTPAAQVVYLRHPHHAVTLPSAELDRELESLRLDAIAASIDRYGRRT